MPEDPVQKLQREFRTFSDDFEQFRYRSFKNMGRGSNEIITPQIRSSNFRTGVSGYRINDQGAEFNDGTFRGTFIIGGTTITIGPTDSIQTALDTIEDAGGGTLYLQAGTYNVSSNIVVPSNTAIIGAGLSSIIDFGGGAFQMQIVGSNAYSTGTVAISNDGTTVTGTGTTFTSGMVGRSILLEDFWYEITAFTDTTHITIGRNYMGTTLSGATYMIATTVGTVNLEDFLISNSSVALIKIQYGNGINIDGVLPVDGLIGIDGDDSSFINIFNSGADLCTTAMTFNNFYFGTFFNNNITECTNGCVFTSIRNWCIDVFAFVNIGGNAMSFTSCSNNSILDFSLQHITGIGIEFVSGNSDIGISDGTIKHCTSDGIKLTATSDGITIGSGLSIHDNGGYGVNIAASTCDGNVITGNFFKTNTSGNLLDAGTGTVIHTNTGIINNAPQTSLSINTTQDIASSLSALNTAGGGTLYLGAGTWTISSAITGYSSIAIVGISPAQTILDFNSTASNLAYAGSNVYTTGTITAASGTAITGSGTTWTAGMAGRHLFLGTRWYLIASVTDTTHLVLAEAYGDNVTLPASYRIATVIQDVVLRNIALKNSTGTAVTFTDARRLQFDNVQLITNNKGIVCTNVSEINCDRLLSVASTSNGIEMTNVGLSDFESTNAVGNGGHGFVFNNVKTCSFYACASNSNTTDGFNITTGVALSLLVTASSNGGQGIEFVATNDDIAVFNGAFSGNTSDGIKLTATSDNCRIYATNIAGNGGYGVNIAASTCDNNTLVDNIFASNSTAALNDSGTGTVRRGNIGLADNETVVTAADDSTAVIDVTTTNQYQLTAMANDTTISTSGTPTAGQKLIIRLKDDGTARALTWDAVFRAVGVTLPTTTVISKTHYIGCIYNLTDTKWDAVAVVAQA